ncbi:hypothetical protein GWK08_18370 [Leptobacterium flavescens]|uniref:DUF1579 domain-containing protein n=1 Tax=Leptobacterium flavescens TaxID=472055 RepID=A0A6P0UQN4_9FLAO|nr:hypothetical protein [Leptobacterium flavescens]NER15425.1 hypothetical protein [Leptobacterium flavescens]
MRLKIIVLFTFFSSFLVAQDQKCNCCTDKHTEFDFWKGDWETYNPNGKLAGTNLIEKIQGNCILRENWVSVNAGYTGTSYNFYNMQSDQWEQIWIDNQGQSLHLKGNLKGKKMVMLSDKIPQANGKFTINRVSWTPNPDGTVRQLWETSEDGTNWTVAFDGLYRRKAKDK